jgi:hypothetical protein
MREDDDVLRFHSVRRVSFHRDPATPLDQHIEAAVEEYLEIGGLIDGGLQQQVEFDLDAFTRATGRALNEEEKSRFRRLQLQANRWTYLGSAMTHERVLETLQSLSPTARERVEEVAPAFC